jgi:transposase-like protein
MGFALERLKAQTYANHLIQEFADQIPKAVETLENGPEDSMQYYGFPEIDARKISSTNILERLNKEIRRRSRVVGIFPSMDSYIRLVCCYLLEYSEDWQTSRCYIQKDIIEVISIKRLAA